MKSPKQIRDEQSTRIFWVIQTVFSFLLARSFLEYKECLLDPFSAQYYLTTLGLLLVYGTVLWSWIDYSYTTIVSPYRFDLGTLERLRFVVDLLIVVLYAYLLFSIAQLQKSKITDIYTLFLCIFFIFVLYFVSGILRVFRYGHRASRLGLITIFGISCLVIALSYRWIYQHVAEREALNFYFIVSTIVLMAVYRIVRSKRAYRHSWIAVDMDGVLADQIEGVLPLLKEKYDQDIKYEQVTQWDLKIGITNIEEIIGEQLKKRKYVMSMPLIEGARTAMDELVRVHNIVIVTARPPESDNWTKEWLAMNKIPFDDYVNMKAGNKQNIDIEVAVLVDDYLVNIQKFLENSDGKAVLFSRPWNQDRGDLIKFIEQGRLIYARDWVEVVNSVKRLLGKSGRKARGSHLHMS